MSGRWFGWLALGFWAAWLAALEGGAARIFDGAAWLPDLTLILVLSLASEAPRSRARLGAVFVGAIEAQFSGLPLTALVAALLLAVEVSQGLRRLLSVDAFPSRLVSAVLVAYGVQLFLLSVANLRTPLPMSPARATFDGAFLSALVTGTGSALIGAWPRRLPGVPLFWKSHGGGPWVAVARVR